MKNFKSYLTSALIVIISFSYGNIYDLNSTSSPVSSKGQNFYNSQIPAPPPVGLVADFTADTTSGNNPLEVHLLDLSTGSPTQWEWDLDNDGVVDAYEQNPEFTYTEPGLYAVSLIVSDGLTSDTLIKEGYIFIDGSSWQCGDSLFDNRDDQTYATVKIGGQCWMAENINIGTRIDGIEEMTNNNIIEKYCYEDDPVNCETFGGLYQWDEMMQYVKVTGAQGICPEGWHVASNDEWKVLEGMVDSQYAIGDPTWDQISWHGFDVGKKLKITTGNGSNEFGFSVELGGDRYQSGWFSGKGNSSRYWSSSEYPWSNLAYYRQFHSGFDNLYLRNVDKKYGFGVRCINNEIEPIIDANFSAAPASGPVPLQVQFTDLSTMDPISWQWDFNNDGTVDSYEQNPIWTYNELGFYSVSLKVSDGMFECILIKEDYITSTFAPVSLPYFNDFATNPDWITNCSGDIFWTPDQGGMLSWHAKRDVNQDYYLPIETNNSDFKVSFRHYVTSKTNNCWISLGLVSDVDGFVGRPNMPESGVWLQVGWTGGGTEFSVPYIRPYAFYTDGSVWSPSMGDVNPGGTGPDSTGFISYVFNNWYTSTLTKYGNLLILKTFDDSEALVGERQWEIPVGMFDYNYLYIGNSGLNDPSQMTGLLDDLNVTDIIDPFEADFSATPTSGDAPLNVQFTDLTTASSSTWEWDFDNDGVIDSEEQNPEWIYTEPGIYSVSLAVSDGTNQDTEMKEDYITVSSDGLVAYYPFNGNANDESGNNHNGTVNGAILTNDRFGISESAYSFDGTDDYVIIPFDPVFDFNNQDFTITVWIKSEWTGSGYERRIINYGGSIYNDYAINYLNDGHVQILIADTPYYIASTYSLADGIPHLISFVRDNGNNTLRLYIDGQLDGSINGGSGNMPHLQSNRRLTFGRKQRLNSQNDSYFYGGLDDIRFYKCVLSDLEIQELYDWSGLISDFQAEPVYGLAPLQVQFSDHSIGLITSWQWDFDNDGVIDSEEQNPIWTYTQTGIYTVKLTVADSNNVVSEIKEDYITVTDQTNWQ